MIIIFYSRGNPVVDMSFPKCLLIGQQDESTKRKLENRSAEAHFRNVVKPLTVCGQKSVVQSCLFCSSCAKKFDL